VASSSGPLTKDEIAQYLGVSVETVWLWTRAFARWLSFDAACLDKKHDDGDVEIYRAVQRIDLALDPSIVMPERAEGIRRALSSNRRASSIRTRRQFEARQPGVERWRVVSSQGVCLVDDYRWLAPLRSTVTAVADFGCWASAGDTCSEPYALLWTLGAERVVVIDRNQEYVTNARNWLCDVCRMHPYFQDYQVEFIVGDMTERIDLLGDEDLEMSYCHDVLYNMQEDLAALRRAIDQMGRVVKPGGWLIAIETKFGAEFEEAEVEFMAGKFTVPRQLTAPTDIGHHFEELGLRRVDLPGAPPYSYSYRK
jgi:SAM-dependent methyltransferase